MPGGDDDIFHPLNIIVIKNNKVEKAYIDRLAFLMNEDLFAMDLKYKIVKTIYNNNPSSFKSLMLNKTLINFLTK